MSEVSATDAARRFADLLDSVEHDGSSYTIIRHGRAVAQIEPVIRGRGAAIKELLREGAPDAAWTDDLIAVRGLLDVEQRP